MTPDVVLEFDGGYLRPLQVQDVHPGYVSGLNDPEVNRFLVGVKHTVQTEASVIAFVESNSSASDAVLFGVWLAGATQLCGTVRLHGIERIHMTACIGVCLFDKAVWGKKVGSKAVEAVTNWAFETMKLRWIEAGAYAGNIASQKAFLSAGYVWVYDIPDKYLFEGRPEVVKLYAARNRNRTVFANDV